METYNFEFPFFKDEHTSYTVCVEMEIENATTKNKHLAASDWDCEDHVAISEVVIFDEKGKEVAGIEVSDELILKEYLYQQHFDELQAEVDNGNVWENW